MNIRTYFYDGELMGRVRHELELSTIPAADSHVKAFVSAMHRAFTPTNNLDLFDVQFWNAAIERHYGNEFLMMIARILDLWIRTGCVSEAKLCEVFADYMHMVIYG